MYTCQGPTNNTPRGINSRAPAFSVVIPLYNKEDTIERCILSVLGQTLPAAEIIVIDDGSTDAGAKRVLERFGNEIRLIHQANGGVSAARNAGIRVSGNPLVALLDADDMWAPHFLEEIASLVLQHPDAGLYATGYQYRHGENNYSTPRIRGLSNNLCNGVITNYFAIAGNGDLPFTASSVVLKRAALTCTGNFPTNEAMGEDQCLWSRMALKKTIAYSRRALSFYCTDATQQACAVHVPREECPFSKRLAMIARNTSPAAHIKLSIERYCAAHLLHIAQANLRTGNLCAAAELLQDPRCRLKPVKYLRTLWQLTWSRLRARVRQLFSRSLPQNPRQTRGAA